MVTKQNLPKETGASSIIIPRIASGNTKSRTYTPIMAAADRRLQTARYWKQNPVTVIKIFSVLWSVYGIWANTSLLAGF